MRRLDNAEGAVKDLHSILAEHLDTKKEGAEAADDKKEDKKDDTKDDKKDDKKEASEPFSPFPAAVLAELQVESLGKAMELSQSAKTAARKVEEAALECGTFASANSKLKEELKDSEAAEPLRQVPVILRRLQAAQKTSEAYVQATLTCEKDMRRREAGMGMLGGKGEGEMQHVIA